MNSTSLSLGKYIHIYSRSILFTSLIIALTIKTNYSCHVLKPIIHVIKYLIHKISNSLYVPEDIENKSMTINVITPTVKYNAYDNSDNSYMYI